MRVSRVCASSLESEGSGPLSPPQPARTKIAATGIRARTADRIVIGIVAILGLAAAIGAREPRPVREPESDVGVSDQAHPRGLRVHALAGLVYREDVLPDGVAGGGVIEPHLVVGVLRLERLQEVDRALIAVLTGPLDGGARRGREDLG